MDSSCRSVKGPWTLTSATCRVCEGASRVETSALGPLPSTTAALPVPLVVVRGSGDAAGDDEVEDAAGSTAPPNVARYDFVSRREGEALRIERMKSYRREHAAVG